MLCSSLFFRHLNNFFFFFYFGTDSPSSKQMHSVRKNGCAFAWISCLGGENATVDWWIQSVSSLLSHSSISPVSCAFCSRGRWTAGLCRARPSTVSLLWCPRASAVPAVSRTPAKPTPYAMTSPRRAQTSTTSRASAAPPGLNMAPSAPCASVR